jgi:hypothetical protein
MTPHALIAMIADIAQRPTSRARKLTMMMANKTCASSAFTSTLMRLMYQGLLRAKKGE